MSEKETGGQAFPCDNIVRRNEQGHLYGTTISSGGMTLRDYFAAKAMQALIAKAPYRVLGDENTAEEWMELPNMVSRGAYDYADTMLEVREE